jgi:hypothetical protein
MRTVIPMVWLMACATSEPTTATDVLGTDTDTDATETGADGCAAPTAGDDWAWTGECPGMETPCELAVDGCALSIAYSSGMSMGMPTGAAVAGSDVTFDSGGCVGTVVDADTIEGTCSSGCTFALTR